jgi:hypothetical protein
MPPCKSRPRISSYRQARVKWRLAPSRFAARLTELAGARVRVRIASESYGTASPPFRVASARQAATSIDGENERTEPSITSALTVPPE